MSAEPLPERAQAFEETLSAYKMMADRIRELEIERDELRSRLASAEKRAKVNHWALGVAIKERDEAREKIGGAR